MFICEEYSSFGVIEVNVFSCFLRSRVFYSVMNNLCKEPIKRINFICFKMSSVIFPAEHSTKKLWHYIKNCQQKCLGKYLSKKALLHSQLLNHKYHLLTIVIKIDNDGILKPCSITMLHVYLGVVLECARSVGSSWGALIKT